MTHLRNRLSGIIAGLAMAVLLLACLPAGQAHADVDAVGLIMEIDGPVTPEIFPFTEVTTGTEITLGPETTMRFAWYSGCLDVTVTGGKVAFDEFGYSLTGTRVDNEADWICPTSISASASGADRQSIAGGIVLRGVPQASDVSPSPRRTLAVVGARADAVAGLRIMRNDAQVAAFEVGGGRPAFNVPGEVITAGERYRLVVEGLDGAILLDQQLEAADMGPLTLIRLD